MGHRTDSLFRDSSNNLTIIGDFSGLAQELKESSNNTQSSMSRCLLQGQGDELVSSREVVDPFFTVVLVKSAGPGLSMSIMLKATI